MFFEGILEDTLNFSYTGFYLNKMKGRLLLFI
jgi:hypothetical protein